MASENIPGELLPRLDSSLSPNVLSALIDTYHMTAFQEQMAPLTERERGRTADYTEKCKQTGFRFSSHSRGSQRDALMLGYRIIGY